MASDGVDIRNREAIGNALKATIAAFGGIDILINTAAMFPSSPDGVITEAQWAMTLDVNVTANFLLCDEAAKIFRKRRGWAAPLCSPVRPTPWFPSAAPKPTT